MQLFHGALVSFAERREIIMKKKLKKQKMILILLCSAITFMGFPTSVLAADKKDYVSNKRYSFLNTDGLICVAVASHNLMERYTTSGNSRIYNNRSWYFGIKQEGVVGIPRVSAIAPRHFNGNSLARSFTWENSPSIVPGGLSVWSSIGNTTAVTYPYNTPVRCEAVYQFNDLNFNPTMWPVVAKVYLGN